MAHSTLRRLSSDSLSRVIFVLIGAIVGILDYFMTRPGAAPDPLDSLYRGFTVTALLFIGEVVLEISNRQGGDTGPHKEFYDRNKNLVGAILKRLYKQLALHIDVKHDDFSVHAVPLPILSHDAFWQCLIDRAARGQNLTVLALHTFDMDVWLNNPDRLGYQKRFCAQGGKVRRILCDRPAPPDPAAVRAAAVMKEVGIEEVRYLEATQDRLKMFGLNWDFAVVQQTGEAAVWRSREFGGEIIEAAYVSGDKYGGVILTEFWNKLYNLAMEIPPPAQA